MFKRVFVDIRLEREMVSVRKKHYRAIAVAVAFVMVFTCFTLLPTENSYAAIGDVIAKEATDGITNAAFYVAVENATGGFNYYYYSLDEMKAIRSIKLFNFEDSNSPPRNSTVTAIGSDLSGIMKIDATTAGITGKLIQFGTPDMMTLPPDGRLSSTAILYAESIDPFISYNFNMVKETGDATGTTTTPYEGDSAYALRDDVSFENAGKIAQVLGVVYSASGAALQSGSGYVLQMVNANGELLAAPTTVGGLLPGQQWPVSAPECYQDGIALIPDNDIQIVTAAKPYTVVNITYTKPVTAVTKPAKVTAKSGKVVTLVKLKWKKVSGAKGYIIAKSSKKKSGYKTIKTLTKGTTVSCNVSAPKKGKTAYYKIRAYKLTASGKKVLGAWSKPIKVKR